MRTTTIFLALLFQLSCIEKETHDYPVNHLLPDEWMTSQFVDSIYQLAKVLPDGVQISIAFANDTMVSYYGFIREKDTIKRIENYNSAFEIGSISKVFTSTVLAEMAYEGLIDPGMPVSNYFDFEWNEGQGITFLQLANHTSGLPRIPPGMFWNVLFQGKNPYRNYDEEQLENYLMKKVGLKSQPGENLAYSNIGVGLLGYALSKAQDQEFEDLLQRFIFQPNQMQNSTVERNRLESMLIPGLDKSGRRTPNWDLGALQGAGAVISTVEDLAKFVLANFDENRKGLMLQRQETFRVNEESAIAMGWFIRNPLPGTSIFWHNGGTGGYRSCMAMDAANRKAVVILSNISAGHEAAGNVDKLCFSLLQMIQ